MRSPPSKRPSNPPPARPQFMLAYADEKGAFIVSNDRFRDHTAYSDSWLGYHRVPYAHLPEFFADRDALLRIAAFQSGSNLECFNAGRALLPQAPPLHGVTVGVAGAGGAGTGAAVTPQLPQLASLAQVPVSMPAAITAAAPPPAPAAPATAPRVTVKVSVPDGALGRIIGAKGSNVVMLRENFECDIDIPKRTYGGGGASGGEAERSGGLTVITIRGAADKCEWVKENIEEKVEKYLEDDWSRGSERGREQGRERDADHRRGAGAIAGAEGGSGGARAQAVAAATAAGSEGGAAVPFPAAAACDARAEKAAEAGGGGGGGDEGMELSDIDDDI